MKITLIYPALAQIGFNSFGRGTPTTNLMSLGLGLIGASIKKHTSWDVDLIDLRKVSGWDQFTNELIQKASDVVGIYVNTVNVDFAIHCAKIAHQNKKIVIMGGPHATLSPQELIDTGFVNHIIVGEGEITIVDMLEKIEAGSEIDTIVQGEKIENLDDLPFTDRNLFDFKGRLKRTTGIFPFPQRYVGVIGSRGCSYNCAFCQPLERKIFGNKVRFRSVENIIQEIKHLKDQYQVNFVMFQDDLLTQWKDWVMDLCGEMKKVDIAWGGLSRANTLDEDIIKAMRDSKCKILQFGFESGSQKMLNFLKKGATVEQNITAAKLCRDHGILIFANYMMGIPTETGEDLEATYNMMKEMNAEIHSANYFSPIPGSNLYSYCEENDLIKAESYEMFARGAIDNKVQGIDYDRLGEFKRRIDKWNPKWYSESHYLSCVFQRWSGLIGEGHFLQVFKEFVTHTPLLNTPLRWIYPKS